MTTQALRKKVIEYVNHAEPNVLEVVYKMMQVIEGDDTTSMMTKEQKKELDKTLHEHKSGKLKYYTVEQAKTMLYKKSKA
jgi:hypothetical protein